MKKIFLTAITFLAVFISAVSISSAQNTKTTLGFVLIGGAEFKTEDFYKAIPQNFKKPSNYSFQSFEETQNKFQKFLFENNLLDEKVPRKELLLNFVAESGCDRILYLVVDATTDHQNNAKSRQKDRVSVQIDGYLCDRYQVITAASNAQKNDSKTSDLRARRGAFKKCLTEIAKNIKLSA